MPHVIASLLGDVVVACSPGAALESPALHAAGTWQPYVRVLVDPGLLLDKQMAAVAKSAFYQLQLISQLQPFLNRKVPATVVHGLITSRLDYCNVGYMGLPLKSVQKLQ